MKKTIDEQVKDALTSLISSSSREKAYGLGAVSFLRENREDYVRLYEEEPVIASLTQCIILKKEIAHYFCTSLSSLKEIWASQSAMTTFADALRWGDTLLIDAIMFILEYSKVPLIQEAIAYSIANCPSMLFQINTACSGLGLCNHLSIKKAILSRNDDIIARLKKNWHKSVFIISVKYLMEDEDVQQVFRDMKPNLLKSLHEEKESVDASFIIQYVDWVQNDPDILEAIRNRFLKKSLGYDYIMAHMLDESGLLQQHPFIQEAVDSWKA